MLPMFLSALDQTIVSTALPAIAAALGNVEQISGVVVSCLLANHRGAGLRPAGRCTRPQAHVLATLQQAQRETVQSEISDAFRGAFLTVASFAGAALLLAWSIPVRRL